MKPERNAAVRIRSGQLFTFSSVKFLMGTIFFIPSTAAWAPERLGRFKF